ncbi:hypothetical protein CC2G_009875 [Coprinopsis cinerea AmutBmut pab1-1]|nr:hypothetical protein CC2G_009875 [Coprinopsis cinerea AmutBmut pab1-1]
MDWETLKLHFALGKQGHWYWQVAATSIALYDHLTTLDLEVELIWKKKVSVVQLLFILNRYSGDALFLHGTAYQLWLKGDAFTRGYAARF